MDIAPIAPQPTESKADKSGVQLADTFDSFLTLLMAQLTNQDPLEPMDPNEFTNQLVNFTNVEQSIATNKNLEQLLALFQSNELSTAVAFIGKAVEAPGDSAPLQDGKAMWAYTLESEADETNLKITDASGEVVYSEDGKTAAGRHEFTWDGTDSTGDPLPEGVYTLTVSAVDSQDTAIGGTVSMIGIADGVLTEGGVNKVNVGGVKVPLSEIVSVNTAL